jgi:glyoxylase-like metal-dependent hydrolase (beta-lactamase superfamily II)
VQVHPYNVTTFILRENPCSTAEAPFMYLLVGPSKALLIDTGDVADPKLMPLAQTVVALLPAQNQSGGQLDGQSKIPLTIVHANGHLDHRLGKRATPDEGSLHFPAPPTTRQLCFQGRGSIL